MSVIARWRAYLRRARVAIWYHPSYAAPELAYSSRVDNIEPDRGDRVVSALLQEGLLRPVDVRSPPAASIRQLRRFHGMDYLERVTERTTLGHVFGLEPEHVDVETLLRASKRAVGGTISAFHEAAFGRLEVAVNLGGGFHHAEPEQGSGFCVFNDIGVALMDLREAGWRGRLAIVDLDFHQGNGNTVAFAQDPSVLVYSIHGAVWTHVESAGREIHLGGPVNDRRYLATLRTSLETSLARFRPDLVVFIAGADVLAGDRLGSFWLTLKGVYARDQHVVQVVRDLGAPLVVTLGGGYGPMAWQSHLQLVRALLTGTWRFDTRSAPSLRHRYARVAASLDPQVLQGQAFDDLGITAEDVMVGLTQSAATRRRFLDYYSAHGLEVVFEQYGIFDKMRGRGYRDLDLEVEPSDPSRQRVRVRGRTAEGADKVLLFELVARRAPLSLALPAGHRPEALYIEWLLLQDPSRSFSLNRPPLPGQDHPGLGLAREIQELLVQACRRLQLAALVNRPSHYHNALACAVEWRFLDPEVEGAFRAMRAVLSGVDLVEASHAVATGRLELADGARVPWPAGEHVLPVDPQVAEHFESARYLEAVRAANARLLDEGLRLRAPEGPASRARSS